MAESIAKQSLLCKCYYIYKLCPYGPRPQISQRKIRYIPEYGTNPHVLTNLLASDRRQPIMVQFVLQHLRLLLVTVVVAYKCVVGVFFFHQKSLPIHLLSIVDTFLFSIKRVSSLNVQKRIPNFFVSSALFSAFMTELPPALLPLSSVQKISIWCA